MSVYRRTRQGRYRSLWRYYLRQCDAVVYVVDSTDASRLAVAFAELRRLLADCALVRRRPRLPLLLVGNKSDRSPPAPGSEWRRLADALCAGCRQVRRPCHVAAGCSALTGARLYHAFDWLMRQVAALRPRWYHDNRPTWY